MENTLASLSHELASIAQKWSPNVVAVDARRHFPSSGVHWRSGVIVTAAHTIQREEEIEVTLPDGKTAAATLGGRDPGTDVAVLRVKGLGSPAVEAGSGESVRVGELALVLGRSPDSGLNASLGILSAASGPWRTWRGGRLDQYLRLDATMFPNSSGGPVVNVHGRIVGVATSALSRIAGLAIPISTVNRVADKLLEKGYVPRGYLGVGVQPIRIPDDLRAKLSILNQGGLMVLNVEPEGAADKAGVVIGDILLGLGDAAIESIEDLQSFSDSGVIGNSVKVKLVRGGALRELTLVVGERPSRRG